MIYWSDLCEMSCTCTVAQPARAVCLAACVACFVKSDSGSDNSCLCCHCRYGRPTRRPRRCVAHLGFDDVQQQIACSVAGPTRYQSKKTVNSGCHVKAVSVQSVCVAVWLHAPETVRELSYLVTLSATCFAEPTVRWRCLSYIGVWGVQPPLALALWLPTTSNSVAEAVRGLLCRKASAGHALLEVQSGTVSRL